MRYSVRTGAEPYFLCLLLVLCGTESAVRADVIISQLANEGVILSDGGSERVMIDGMVVEPYSVYGGLSKDLVEQFLQAGGPFAGVRLALASHQHHDHNQPDPACRFLQESTGTLFASSVQVLDLMREKCRPFVTASPRVRILDPSYEQPAVIQEGAIRVTAFRLSHGTGKYAGLQNFAHLVEIGGLRVLHLGDAAMDPEEFVRAGVDAMKADVALIPFWFFQPGPGGDIVRRFLNTPHQIAEHIPPREMQEVLEHLRLEYPRVLVLQKPLDSVQFSSTTLPLP